MSKFNTRTTNKTTNLAGGVAYSHNDKMALIMAVLSTFLEDKFYEKGNTRIARIKELCGKVEHEFIAKLAIVARNEFHLRSITHLLVGELSKLHRGDDLIKKTILKISERPDDLTELVAYIGKPLPNQVKKGIRRSLFKFSPYQLSKYRGEGKKTKLVDLFNLVHPNAKYATNEQKQAWADLLKGELKNTETWEARLSSGEDKAKVWKDLVMENKIGYMALLRNLRNISNQADQETIKRACEILSKRENVKHSKQLPFRYFSAYENVENQEMLSAISKALDYSMDNVPTFNGKTLIAVDGSGSMNGDPIKKASIFASSLFKSNDADLIIYDTDIKTTKLIKSDSTLTLTEKIIRSAHGGGTDTSLVFQYAIKNGIKYDRIIILSDNESWSDRYYGNGTNSRYNEYKKTNDCFVYAIDIQGYGTKDITGSKVFHLTGWSERLMDFMSAVEKENQLIEIINKTEI